MLLFLPEASRHASGARRNARILAPSADRQLHTAAGQL
ncbi:hypothetical protein C7S15_7077 [Burkholderia cepacia]|nr:hypothetical protein [Burkholderia cepacia]